MSVNTARKHSKWSAGLKGVQQSCTVCPEHYGTATNMCDSRRFNVSRHFVTNPKYADRIATIIRKKEKNVYAHVFVTNVISGKAGCDITQCCLTCVMCDDHWLPLQQVISCIHVFLCQSLNRITQ